MRTYRHSPASHNDNDQPGTGFWGLLSKLTGRVAVVVRYVWGYTSVAATEALDLVHYHTWTYLSFDA